MLNVVALLKEKSLTVTPQRVEIVTLLSTHQHINVDELYALLYASFPSVSLATVYKNINIMLKKLLLSEVQIPNKKNVYEIMKAEHSHVVCLECNEILDLTINTSELLEAAELQSGFSIDTSSLIFCGTCASCTKS
ncbi:Fur family transcriptional regulator [Sulfurimonas sp.]|uniref:Fur family transcriptional regulator n=1 Tax=Sulfurimonas sp. TaxID=2022749 RepID=UPI0039E26733